MEESPLRIVFVLNKNAGKKKGIDWETEIKNYFNEKTHHTTLFLMPEKEARKEFQSVIKTVKPHKVVAVGGDGTVTFVANELLGEDIEMGILPAGSANGMAKELSIPIDPQKALDIILNGQVKKSDVIRINEDYICLHLSDIGANAQIIKYFEQGSFRGFFGYTLALMKVLRRRKRFQVIVQSKHAEIKRTAIMVIFANASKYGTGAQINPKGDISDGYFEVIVVQKMGLAELLRMFLKFEKFNPEHIEVLSARSAFVETRHPSHFQVDGEYLGKVSRVKALIIPGQLKLLVPVEIE